jgi:hypothetical protein
MRRELRQCPVALTGDSDRIHRKALLIVPPALPNAKGFRSWTTGTHKLKIQGRCGMSTILIIPVYHAPRRRFSQIPWQWHDPNPSPEALPDTREWVEPQ